MGSISLKVLLEHQAVEPQKQAHIFVLGFARAPQNWPWLKSCAERLSKQRYGCVVVAVCHQLTSSQLPTWSRLVELGPHLLDAISEFRANRNATTNPILVVCHSLAGFVLKQALAHAQRTYKGHSALVVSALSGAVLIGCPHLRRGSQGEWQRAIGILLAETREVNTTLLGSERELRTLLEICESFEQAARELRLLSVHETVCTKLSRAISINSTNAKRPTLVDQNAAKTGLRNEQLTAVQANHIDACMLKDAAVQEIVVGFLGECLDSPSPSRPHMPVTSQSLPLPVRNLSQDSSSSSVTLSASPIECIVGFPKFSNMRSSKSMPNFAKVEAEGNDRKVPKLPCAVIDQTVFVEDFISRDDVLEGIDDALRKNEPGDEPSRVRYVSLYGPGGIGKTSTAAQWWDTRGDEYRAKFWIRADNKEKLVESFSRIAVELGLLNDDQTQVTAFNRKVVMDWLENPVETLHSSPEDTQKLVNWLIVFDNVEDIDTLEEFSPHKGGGSIIVTSRNPTSAWRPQGAVRRNEGIKMKAFGLEEATKFLQRLAPAAGKRRDPGAAEELAKRLDCIPFPLRCMGERIHRTGTTFRRFLEIYQSEATQGNLSRFNERSVKKSATQYDFNMSTVWAIDKLREKTLSLINVLALMDPDPIEESILIADTVSLTDSLYPNKLADFDDAKANLSSSSLITDKNDDDIEEDEISVHRTVQDAVRAQMSSDQFHVALSTLVELLLEKWPAKGRMWHYPVDRWPHCEKLSPHLIRLHGHYMDNCGRKNCYRVTSKFAQLLIYGGWYWGLRGDVSQAKKFFDTAENLADKLPDGAALLEDVWMCQGCLATETNDGVACWKYYSKLKERTLAQIPVPRTPDEYERVATSHNEMGIACMMWGKKQEAKAEFERARSLAKERQKESETVLSVLMFATANLGLVYCMLGHNDEALAILEESLDDWRRQKVEGDKDSFIPGRLMYAMGNVKIALGCNEQGLIWHKKALSHYLKTIGQGHHRTADAYHKLAEDYFRLGRCHEARECINQALVVFESKKCYTPELMRTTHLLGMLCEAEELHADAKRFMDDARSMYAGVRRERKEEMPSRMLTIEDFNKSVTFWSR